MHLLVNICIESDYFFFTNLLVYNNIIININVILTFTTLKKIDKITLTT